VPTSTSQRPQLSSEITRRIVDLAKRFDLSPIRQDEFRPVHRLAARLMEHKVTPVDVMARVHAIQPAASVAFREAGEVTGIVGALLLRRTAMDALMHGDFDGAEVDLDLLARADEVPDSAYGWGIAASTKSAGAAISAFGVALMDGPLGALVVVSRAVTPVGRHVCITRFGYRPLRNPDDDLLIRAPLARRLAA
jgi:hypothetical protein